MSSHDSNLTHLLNAERQRYIQRHPVSQSIAHAGQPHMLFGVPLHWMSDWGTPFPMQVSAAQGATLTVADGHQLIDFCLGDTGAMFGHSPPAVAEAIQAQASRGLTAMLPGSAAGEVSKRLSKRFGMSQWQFALSASDANRFLLRWVRAATNRKKLLVFNGCYHGTVDDVFVDLVHGVPTQRDSLLGQVQDLTTNTVVVEFNDLPALEAALQSQDVAAILAEPVMTNIGMVLPDPGFWQAAQALARQHGTLLILDETHTISSGPGGYARAHGLAPDAVVLGKPLGGGLPCAAYGMSAELAARAVAAKQSAPPGHSGIGTTLSGNLLSMAAINATLEHLMTEANFTQMTTLCTALANGLQSVIEQHDLPWCVSQVGARCEFQFCKAPPRNGTEAEQAMNHPLERLIHLFLLNRDVMITPFHNMMLISPATTHAHVEQLLKAFDEACGMIAPALRASPDGAFRPSPQTPN